MVYLLLKRLNSLTLLGQGEIVNWGRGSQGALATENHADVITPHLNEAIHHVAEEEHSNVIKVNAAGNHILALFGKNFMNLIVNETLILENGSLYGWGNNELGQLGIKKDVGITK